MTPEKLIKLCNQLIEDHKGNSWHDALDFIEEKLKHRGLDQEDYQFAHEYILRNIK